MAARGAAGWNRKASARTLRGEAMSEAENEGSPAEATPGKPQTSRLARASLWFGIASLVAPFAGMVFGRVLQEITHSPVCTLAGPLVLSLLFILPAVVCGWLAAVRVRRSGGTLRGRGRAIAGIMLACLSAGVAVFLTYSLVEALEWADIAACKTNMAIIRTAILQYARVHDGRLPQKLSELVSEDLVPADMFACPATGRWDEVAKDVDARSDYIYAGAGHHINEAESFTIPILWDRPQNHGGKGVNVAYLDGHVQWHEQPPAFISPEPAAGAAGHPPAQ